VASRWKRDLKFMKILKKLLDIIKICGYSFYRLKKKNMFLPPPP
jgi:hypothetical protein